MGVVTSADEHRNSAIIDVDSAIRNLSQILIERCWGYDEYSDEYKGRLDRAFSLLRDAQKELET